MHRALIRSRRPDSITVHAPPSTGPSSYGIERHLNHTGQTYLHPEHISGSGNFTRTARCSTREVRWANYFFGERGDFSIYIFSKISFVNPKLPLGQHGDTIRGCVSKTEKYRFFVNSKSVFFCKQTISHFPSFYLRVTGAMGLLSEYVLY